MVMANKKKVSRWTPEDYASLKVFGSGAIKLADSQVAPLVAQSRGYSTVEDAEGAKSIASLAYAEETQKRALTRRLTTMTQDANDFLVLPWYSLAAVASRQTTADSACTQVRPARPLMNAKTKKAPKYELLAGHDSVLDVNPATPLEWLTESPTVLITEGCMKGDAALSAKLLDAGIDRDALSAIAEGTQHEARLALQALMTSLPRREWVTVMSLVGVGNWHKQPEWNSVRLTNRDVWLAFDGDLRTNRAVWDQTERMWEFILTRKGAPKLLDLGGASAEKDALTSGYDGKVGIDDYLSHVGTWKDLEQLLESGLPGAPERTKGAGGYRPGDFRVTDDGLSVEECVKRTDATGDTAVIWEPRLPYGGRVKRISSLHAISEITPTTGKATPQNVIRSAKKGQCVIEINWRDADGVERSAEITGTSDLLLTSPTDWNRANAHIPDDVAALPRFPPRKGAEADGFREAIKAFRADETERADTWDVMGYVPTSSGWPVYIIGNQVLGRTRSDEASNFPGVTNEVLDGASRFGVVDTYWEHLEAEDLDGWKAQIRADIETVVRAFVVESPWKDPTIGPIAVAVGLRATAPAQNVCNLYVSGGSGAGKSYLASFIANFVAAPGRVFTENSLPGSGNDTFAALEHSVSRTPIFFIDDIAPTASRREQENQAKAIENIIRAKTNGGGRRRGTADGDQRAVQLPRAVQVFTAENGQTTPSIRQRLININLVAGDTDSARAKHLEKLTRSDDQPLSRLTAAMIRFWLNVDINETDLALRDDTPLEGLRTWADLHDLAHNSIEEVAEDLERRFEEEGAPGGVASRQARTWADILFTLDVLLALGKWAGLKHDDPVLQPFSDTKRLRTSIVRRARIDVSNARADTIVHRLMAALRDLLESGKAHLAHPTISGARPVESGENADWLNRSVGWRMNPRIDSWEPQGEQIGYLGRAKDGDELIALFSSQTAFNLAARHFPDLIPQGQRATDTWRQVWTEDGGAFVSKEWKQNGSRDIQARARLRGSGEDQATMRALGVPVLLSKLLYMEDPEATGE